jgi:hypothetical protein
MALPLLVLVLCGTAACGDNPAAAASAAEREFLRRHWQRPIPPQGPGPAAFSPIERSLAPESCGTCHPAQLADWTASRHTAAMGPGVAGQLVEMIQNDPDSARNCLSCHAPLAEQAPVMPGPSGIVRNPGFDEALHQQGLVCAACHVRRHERFGPPRRAGASSSEAPGTRLPHNGATRTTAFLKSEFCASCHQFDADGFALNGKLLENTYEEWKASPAARRGLQCQDCHMPDRRHLWRGIHDREMVMSGVEIALTTDRPRYRPGEHVTATLTVANTGVGHYFPTYVTPRVVLRAELIDSAGRTVPGSARETVIGREVPIDLSREIADTRIAPGGQFALEYRHALDRPGLLLRVNATVYPDHFYTGFFQSMLSSSGDGTAQLRQALAASRRSAFTIFERDVPLT